MICCKNHVGNISSVFCIGPSVKKYLSWLYRDIIDISIHNIYIYIYNVASKTYTESSSQVSDCLFVKNYIMISFDFKSCLIGVRSDDVVTKMSSQSIHARNLR